MNEIYEFNFLSFLNHFIFIRFKINIYWPNKGLYNKRGYFNRPDHHLGQMLLIDMISTRILKRYIVTRSHRFVRAHGNSGPLHLSNKLNNAVQHSFEPHPHRHTCISIHPAPPPPPLDAIDHSIAKNRCLVSFIDELLLLFT